MSIFFSFSLPSFYTNLFSSWVEGYHQLTGEKISSEAAEKGNTNTFSYDFIIFTLRFCLT